MKRYVFLLAAAAVLTLRPLAADGRDRDKEGHEGGNGGEKQAEPAQHAAPARHAAPAQHGAPQHQARPQGGGQGRSEGNGIGRVQGPGQAGSHRRPSQAGPGEGQDARSKAVPHSGQRDSSGMNEGNRRDMGRHNGQGQPNAGGIVDGRSHGGKSIGGRGVPATARYRTQAAVDRRLSSLGVHGRPPVIRDRAHVLVSDRRHSVIHLPDHGPGNLRLTQRPLQLRNWSGSHFQAHMSLVARPDSMRRFHEREGFEREANHYYWHDEGGYRYCHYLDPFGFHWYGWYVGSNCLWVRFYSNRYWTYDNGYDRWMYWDDNRWWWQGPTGVVYLYNDGEYIPTVPQATVAAPAFNDVAPSSRGTYDSPDGSRRVKVVKDGSGDAFLYDITDPPAFSPVYLGGGVQSVRYSDTSDGQPLQIELNKTDGTFSIVDQFGHGVNFSDQ